jgi:uncharacterized membrane protein
MQLLLLLAVVALVVALMRLRVRMAGLQRDLRALEMRLSDGAVAEAPLAARAMIATPDAAVAQAAAPRQRFEDILSSPEPKPEAPAPAVGETLSGLFERLVGGRLLIWVGGIALAVAGIFLVRYSVEHGLIAPPFQMAMAAGFGLLLLAAGEYARSRPDGLVDRRVAQSLVGAAIFILYATAYGSMAIHHLISPRTASVLLVLVTGAALGLSLRHGAPTALMGLVGGFLTPLLVGERDAGAVPLILYVALLDVAIFTLASRRRWTWLAAAAVLASFGWMTPYLFDSPANAGAAGMAIVAIAVSASLIRTGEGWQLDFLRPALIGLLQLGLIVARTDLGLTAWGLYAMLAGASFVLAGRRPEFRPIPAFALVLALLLLATKALIEEAPLLLIGGGITLLFAAGGGAWALRRPGELLWAMIACAGFAAPAILLRAERPELLALSLWGTAFAILSAGPLLLAWRARARADGAPALLAAGTALLLLGLAAADLLPRDLIPAAWMALALAAAYAARAAAAPRLAVLAAAAATASLAASVALVPWLWAAMGLTLIGEPVLAESLPGVLRVLEIFLLPAPLLLLVWRTAPLASARLRRFLAGAAGALAIMAAYLLFKHAFGLVDRADFVARGFAERLIVTQALFLAGWLVCTERPAIPGLGPERRRVAGIALIALAAVRLFWFDMIVDNPVVIEQSVGRLPVLNLLAPTYLLSAWWLYRARRGASSRVRSGLWLVLALASLVLGVMLIVRQLFQGAILTAPHIPLAESYGYSLAGVALSTALLLFGVRLPDKALRVAGLLLLTVATVKVFAVDAAALGGLLRILSFLVLGIALIGIGKLYTKVLDAEAAPAPQRA